MGEIMQGRKGRREAYPTTRNEYIYMTRYSPICKSGVKAPYNLEGMWIANLFINPKQSYTP
jgi:hypothetical protein